MPAVVGGALLLGSTSASAAVFSVTSAADAGPGTLRDAIAQANASAGLDTIDITVAGPIALTSGDLDISDPVVIEGHGVVIDAVGNGQRIFETTAAAATVLRDMTLRNAMGLTVAGACIRSRSHLTLEQVDIDHCQTTGNGGAIHHRNGDLELVGVTITDASASRGGAIDCDAAVWLTIDDSVFAGNTAAGLGGHLFAGPSTDIVWAIDTQWIDGSAFRGGAIFTRAGNTWLNGNDLLDNTASDRGGAIALRGVDTYLGLYNSVASGNVADRGGALHAAEGNQAYLDHTELVGNTAAISGGAIFGNDVHVDLYDTFVSGNQAVAQDGGGLFLIGGSALGGVANAFTANDAGRDGGGVFLDIVKTARPTSGRLFMLNLTAHSNTAGREGGGLWITTNLPSPDVFSLRSSTVAYNSAGQNAGGVYVDLQLPGAGQNNDWSGNVFDGNLTAGVPDDCQESPTSTPMTWVDNLIFAPSTCGAAISGQSALLPTTPAPADICLVPGAGSPVVDANNFPFAIDEDILHQPRSTPGDMGSCEQ